MTKAYTYKLRLMMVTAGLLLVVDLRSGGARASAVQPTPCITPPGAIYSVNCDGVNSNGGVLGDNAAAPSPAVSASADAGAGGSSLPDTGAMMAVSTAVGLGAMGYAGRTYLKSRRMAGRDVVKIKA